MPASVRLFKESQRLPKQVQLSWRTWLVQVMAKSTVLWVALGLALLTSLYTLPSAAQLDACIDTKTLACLASLMTASGGLMICGAFDRMAAALVSRCSTARSLTAIMVLGTFFLSMFITNDVALIVLVPMALLAARRAGIDPLRTVILQTIAANTGSIILPMGNPQNLYLYSRYEMAFWPFLQAVLPLSLAGLAVLCALCAFGPRQQLQHANVGRPHVRREDVMLYCALFAVAAAGVFGVLDWRLALAAAAGVAAAKGRQLIQQIDFALLLTFVGFFVFVGNIARVPAIADALGRFAGAGVFWAAAAASQVISNVPAAVLLSGFTEDAAGLLAGVSAGGCGTLIASMASLITYKLYMRDNGSSARFMWSFTLYNILFLGVMIGAWVVF